MLAPFFSMIPNPVMRKPGSMPSILRAGPAIARHYTFGCAARAPLRRLLIDHRGGVNVLHVVEALQGIEQLLHPSSFVTLERILGGGLHGELGELGLQARLGEG